ncbi:MAG: hypothetical protein ABJP45_06730 [Cyclobacteriaceae bacterium]
MKNYKGPIALFLCLFSTMAYTQSLSSLSLEFAIPNSYDGLILSPSAQFDANNHTWSIGPTVLFSFGDQIEQRDGTKLTGLYAGYSNFPQGREGKVNMFYGFGLWAQRVKDEQNSQFFNNATSSFEDITIEQKDNIIQFFVNLGIAINLTDKLAVKQVIGTGLNATSRTTTSPFDDFDDTFYSQDWLLKTSLTFRLN